MAVPITIAKISAYSAGFIKKNWHIILILIFIFISIPFLIFSAALNILFPQVDSEGFSLYKSLTDESGISWVSFMAYDVVRLDNYLKENRPDESVFDLIKVGFTEYEIIETEEEVTKIVGGRQVKDVVTWKEYRVVRELEAQGYPSIKELLISLNYNTSEENMTVNSVAYFLSGLNEKEEYEIETTILSDEEISDRFDEKHKEWFFALVEILPLLDPSSEFDPDKFMIPEIIDNPDIPSIWPASGIVTSEFGEVRITHIHQGIDIANVTGTPISATANGTVIAVGTSGNFGKRIMIYHGTNEEGNTYVTVYAHLSKFKVDVGQKVGQRDIIGLMGNTGVSTGTHLHYEVRVNGTPVDPRYFLP
jgi:murein DD-endopeptidase MepM/ murein hydrolase activator NlpD